MIELFNESSLLALIIFPLIGVVLLMLIPSQYQDVIKYSSLTISSVVSLISLLVYFSFDHSIQGYQFLYTYSWLDIPGAWGDGAGAISLDLGIDGIAALMVLLTGIVMFTGTIVSWSIKEDLKDFFILYFLLLSGVFGVFVSLDMFFFFFFYELSVLPMYLLIGKWGSSSKFPTFARTKEYSAMKLTLVLVAGSVLIWVAIIAIFIQSNLGTFNILEIEEVISENLSTNFQKIAFPLLMIGFGILAGLWPFHTWSPDGHVAAPTGVSMLHAGVLMKLGAFGIIRVGVILLPEGASGWMPILIILGTVNVVYGAISAISQHDLKYVIGYSSVSHMGYVIMGIATLHPVGVTGAVLQMFSHGIMTALMFAMVGSIYERTHIRDTNVLNGLIKRMGTASCFFAIAGLASLGLPGLSGFIAEFMVFVGVFRTYLPLAVLAVIGAAITAVYMLRLLAKTFFGEADPRWDDLPDSSPIEKAVGAVFVAILIVVGVWPAPLVRVINIGVDSVLQGL